MGLAYPAGAATASLLVVGACETTQYINNMIIAYRD